MSFYPLIYQNGWLGFPTDRDFEFVEHPTKGKCVVASRDFAPSELVFVFTGQLTLRITLRSLRLNEHLHVHDPYFMGFVAHSCDPNCTVEMSKLQFTATRFIPSGELITMDYMQTEDRLFRRFECSCGTPACRGLIG